MNLQNMVISVWMVSFSYLAWAEGLDRLFTTPQERVELDEKRFVKEPIPPPEPKTPPPPSHIIFNGVVIRSGGATTVWVNGSEELFRPSFKVEVAQRKGLSVPIILSKGQEVQLEPGEILRTQDGKVFEDYQISK